jgi:phosphoribosylformylglycinamidine (FGAM) synthase-like enzyme
VLGVVGLIDDADSVVTRAFRSDGDVIVLLGETRNELGGSEYLKVVHGIIRGVPPALDLTREAALHRVLIAAASSGLTRSAQDCSEGGLAVTVAECCIGTGLGARADVPATSSTDGFGDIATLFSESASRVVVSVAPGREAELMSMAAREQVPARRIGVVAGKRLQIAIDGRTVIDEPLSDVERTWSTAIESYFDAARAVA